MHSRPIRIKPWIDIIPIPNVHIIFLVCADSLQIAAFQSMRFKELDSYHICFVKNFPVVWMQCPLLSCSFRTWKGCVHDNHCLRTNPCVPVSRR
jgi:hypothetical protein